MSKVQNNPSLPKPPTAATPERNTARPAPAEQTPPKPAAPSTAASAPATLKQAPAMAKTTTTSKPAGQGDVFTQGTASAKSTTPAASAKGATSAQKAAASTTAAKSAATPQQPVVRNVTFTYDAGSHGLTNLQLKGSFNKQTGAFDPNWGGGDTVPMKDLGNGKWSVTVPLADDGQTHDWRWGVVADGPAGKAQWAVMGEDSLKFNLAESTKQVSYSPTTYDRMGAHRQANGDASFQLWAPDAKAVNVKITDQDGNVQRVPMAKGEDGVWAATTKDFDKLAGKAYAYEVTDSEGMTVDRPDPYARVMQGEQRGVGKVYILNATGQETNPFDSRPHTEFMRFDVQDHPDASKAQLVFKDDTGRQLTKQELLQKIGDFDPVLDPKLKTKLRDGQFDELWSNNVNEDGSINLTKEGGAWATMVCNPEKLVGLHYELQVFNKDGQTGKDVLVGDQNKDGKLTDAERKASVYNDPWNNVITRDSGSDFRTSVIADTNYDFKNDSAAREKDPKKWVIYQLHPGSIFGEAGNTERGSFKDLQDRLAYFKSLGVNTLEMLPANEVEGTRDWGYMGANSLAVESGYGFEENGRYVTGQEALKRFIDEAHRQGFNVVNDVVYNHVGGNHNFLWNMDGKENPYFNWSKDPSKMEMRDTPWGAMPAYNNEHVKQLFVDHAVAQVDEFHFDGLRFDFTQPIKGDGGVDGWNMLREINRQVHFFKPGVFTAAEQFDYDPNMTRPAGTNGAGGGGFDAQWFTEFQHRLVHDNDNPSIIQQAENGWQTNMDKFMDTLVNPRGLSSWANAVTIISDHDEVGNADRTINVADNYTTGLPPQFSRNMARFAAGIGLASPGTPMFFQGDESMAQNKFRWGNPSTWDVGWSWQSLGKNWNWDKMTFNDQQKATYDRLFATPPAQRTQDPAYQALADVDKQVFNDLAALSPKDRDQAMLDIARKQTFEFYQDAIALKTSSPAFDSDAAINRVYTHNDNSVMAFTRKKGDDEFLVVGSLNHNNLQGYGMELPPGQWKEVLNSDAARYGGSNFGNFGATLNGGASQVNIPSGGYVVLKRVG